MPAIIAALVSAKVATLYELQSVYGVEDAYNLLEIITVDATNAEIVRKAHGNKNH